MKLALIAAISIAALVIVVRITAGERQSEPTPHTPVLVELFTSEGCSSCPPADRLLQTLDQQPETAAEIIVLSEHVDYWNHIGWKDPFSAHFFSDRQSTYARRFGLDSVYTPQMVVDGTSEFTGSNAGKADDSIQKAERISKVPIRLSNISFDVPGAVRAHLETGPLDNSFGVQSADLYVAAALNHAESQVSAGENSGRRLTHVAVVRTLTRIATLQRGESVSRDFELNLKPSDDPNNLRLIAFLQEPHQGRVIGATRLIRK